MRSTTAGTAPLAILALALALTGCAGGAEPEGDPEGSATAPSTEQAEAPALSTPDSCAPLGLDPESPVSGAALGACYAEALVVLSTGAERVEALDRVTTGVFDFSNGFEFAGDVTDSDGTRQYVMADDVLYANDGSGWVRGDEDSEDGEEAFIGSLGSALVSAADPRVIAASLQLCPEWRRESALTPVSLENGTAVDAVTYSCTAPYTFLGSTIDSAELWFEEDWTPVGHRTTGGGSTATSHLSDMGEPVSIVAPI